MNNIEKELHNTNEEIRQYEFECHWKKLGSRLAKDLIFSRIDKSVATKKDVQKGLKNRKYHHLSNSQLDVNLNEHQLDHAVATLTVDYHFTTLNDGVEHKGLARNIRFFRKKSGKWKLYAWFNEEVK